MAAIDFGTLVIKDGKVINETDELFPDVVIGSYTFRFYKDTLKVLKTETQEIVENYVFGWDGKLSYHLNTVAGEIDVRSLNRKSCRGRWVAKVARYTIIFGYGIDPNKNYSFQKKVMHDYGFSNREKRIVSKYLWGRKERR